LEDRIVQQGNNENGSYWYVPTKSHFAALGRVIIFQFQSWRSTSSKKNAIHTPPDTV